MVEILDRKNEWKGSKRIDLHLVRVYDNGDDTIGILFFRDRNGNWVYVYTLEDEYRKEKVRGETRIPAGTYEIIIRKYGGHYEKYKKHARKDVRRFTREYGVLQIDNVPNFKHILIHIGNWDEDTAGCILIGNRPNNNSIGKGMVGESTNGYIFFLNEIREHLIEGRELYITIYDLDREMKEIFSD